MTGSSRVRRRRGALLAASAALGLALPALASRLPARATAPAVAPSALYVVESGANSLTPVPSATASPGTRLAVGSDPQYAALTPDGSTALVTDSAAGTVTRLDLTGQTASRTIAVGTTPEGVAVAPDGVLALVTDSGSGQVTPVNAVTGATGPAIAAGTSPWAVAIAPDAGTAYVTDAGAATVTPITLKPSPSAGPPIPVGLHPEGIAISPDGRTLWVVDNGSNSVTPVSLTSQPVTPAAPIAVGTQPTAIAITPDGSTAFVTNSGSGTISVLDLAHSRVGATLTMPTGANGSPMVPSAVTVTPDGSTTWVTSTAAGALVPIAAGRDPSGVATYTVGRPLNGLSAPVGAVVTPDQAPVAGLAASAAQVAPGTTVTLTATGHAAYSQVSAYQFKFGDGSDPLVVPAPSPASPVSVTHTYEAPGTYVALVYEADTAGTGVSTVYTGQTASRYSPAQADGLPQDAAAVEINVEGQAIPARTPLMLVANFGGSGQPGTVTPVGVPQGGAPVVGTPMAAGDGPAFVAFTPDARAAVVSDYNGSTLTPVAVCPGAAGQTVVAGRAVATGARPTQVAVAPTPVGATASSVTWTAYVVDGGSDDLRRYALTVDTQSCTASLSVPSTGGILPVGPLSSGDNPYGIAVSPDGSTAWVTDTGTNTVTPVNLVTGAAGTPVGVGVGPEGVAISPDGQTVYVVNNGSNSVTPVSTADDLPGAPINVGAAPTRIAITPDGSRAFVVDSGGPASVTAVDLSTRATTTVPLGQTPTCVTVTPDGSTAWVSTFAGALYPVDAADLRVGSPLTGFVGPVGLAITPDQEPVAALAVSTATPATGSAVTFDATSSTVAYGTISAWQFIFGDGTQQVVTAPSRPVVTHTYTSPGTYPAVVYERDSAGTAYTSSYTGQTYGRYAPMRSDNVPLDEAGVYIKVSSGGGSTIASHSPVEYVTDLSGGTVTPVQVPPGGGAAVTGAPIPVGKGTAFVAATPDGTALVASDYVGNAVVPVAVCDTGSGSVRYAAGTAVSDGLTHPAEVAISPARDGSGRWTVLVADLGGNDVHRYQLTVDSGSCQATLTPMSPVSASVIPVGAAPYGVVISSDGSTAYVSNSGSGTVTPIDLKTGSAATPVPVGQTPEGLALSGDGKTLWVADNGSNAVTPVSTATGAPGAAIAVGSGPTILATTPSSTSGAGTVFVVAATAGQVDAVDVATGAVTAITLPGGVQATGVGVSPDGSLAWATSYASGAAVPVSVANDAVLPASAATGLGHPVGDAGSVTP